MPRRPKRGVAVASILVALILGIVRTSRAQVTPERCLERLGKEEIRTRIDFIQRALDDQRLPTRGWWAGWIGTLGVLGTTQVALAVASDSRGERISSLTSAGGSYLGVIVLGLRPPPAVSAAGTLRHAEDDTLAELRNKLRLAEHLLRRSAESQERSALGQLQVLAWIVASGLLVGVGYGEWARWGRIAAGSVVVFELRAFSRPTGSVDAWEDYKLSSNACMAPQLARERDRGPEVQVAGGPGGIGLTVRF
jgi:hypothetical protein